METTKLHHSVFKSLLLFCLAHHGDGAHEA